MMALFGMKPRDLNQKVSVSGVEFLTDAFPRIRAERNSIKVDPSVQDGVEFLWRRSLCHDHVFRSVARHGNNRVANASAKPIEADMPALVDACVIVGVVARHHPHRRARKYTGLQTDDRRLKQVRVQDIDLIATQELCQSHHTQRILDAASTLTAETLDSLRLQILSQPTIDGVERREIHLESRTVMPPGELGKEPAGVTVLSEVQDSLHYSIPIKGTPVWAVLRGRPSMAKRFPAKGRPRRAAIQD